MLLTWLSLIIALGGFGFASFLVFKLIKQKVASQGLEVISAYLEKGVMIFIFKEYFILSIFILIIAVILAALPMVSWQIVLTFILGAIFSMTASFIGLKITVLANSRTAENCAKDLRSGFDLALSSGSAAGLAIASLGLLGLSFLYLIFKEPAVIYGFGLGASLAALFIRIGGGIYTKAADMGADLAGKLENNIPEDDPRNPASIANSVGDNVGDVAGVSADLFESYVDALMVAMVLGVVFLPLFGSQAIALPLLIAGLGLIASILSNLSAKFFKVSLALLLSSLNWLAVLLVLLASFLVIKYAIGDLNIFFALASGLVAGVIINLSTEYFTSNKRRLVQKLAQSSQTGLAANIISGLSLGFFSSLIPVLTTVIVIYFSYDLAGFYGLALAVVGLLSTLGLILATNIYGPITDNAASLALMAGLGNETLERAKELDALGNTTMTIGKGLAITSATLTALLLLIAFAKIINLEIINLISPQVLAGLLIGGLLPFVFTALILKSVSQATAKIVEEIRRQFREIAGLISSQAEPDYKKCIEISTLAALKQMMAPGVLAMATPVIVGFWLGEESLAGLLAGSIIVSFLLALFMTNAGGAWDNAKKFIEAGNLGGKNSEAHKAAIVGDIIGDPLKDVAGPALNILIKLMAIIAIIIAPLLLL